MASKIQIKFHQVKHRFTNSKNVKEILENIFQEEGYTLKKLTYIFCDDAYLLNLNVNFLHHDTYTDILTFDLSEPDDGVVAEIYISIERVIENSVIYKIPLVQELHRVMIHGILHLCGYNDHSETDTAMMREKEKYYLSNFL
jgi:rRNA maturation RNase YbeY